MADGRRFPEAAACLRQALNRAGSQVESSDARETIRLLQEITDSKPGWARGRFSLGCAFEHLGDYGPAREHLANALRLDPAREAAVESLFARMHMMEQKWTAGMAAADRALAANPDYYLALIVRSKCCAALGWMDECAKSKRRALGIAPDRALHSDLLFEMNYLADCTPEALHAEAGRWNSLYAAPLEGRIRPHSNTPDPDRPLKLGYVSPDLRNHPMMRFLPPVLEHHDRSEFEVFAYAAGTKSDPWTERIRQSTEHFRSIRDPEALAAQVRQDGIDILIDLAGHSMGPALLAFALKPAPVQVSWMGAMSTTGLSSMDYFLGDPRMPCPGTDHLFTETVYRLPDVLCCYRPVADIPVADAPCVKRGYVTFGCFNNPQKIGRDVVKLWSAILHLAPGSRLLLKFRGLEQEEVQAGFRGWFAADGIPPERLLFAGSSIEYLAAYGGVDIALDPFPYSGGSTTLDALWMGVPVVTLAGRLAVQMSSANVLAAVGLSDMVAHTPEQYLKIALYLAGVLPAASLLRCDLRQALRASPWMDETGVVRSVEDAFREMWRAWCRKS